MITGIIFYVKLTTTAPVFPATVIVMAPVVLLAMNRMWNTEKLASVGAF